MKIHKVGAEMFHADGQTDRHEANTRFSQFCEKLLNAPNLMKKGQVPFIRVFSKDCRRLY